MTYINTTASPIFVHRIKLQDVVLTIIFSSASIIGSWIIFFCHYLRYKRGLSIDTMRHYLIALTFADMLNAIGQLLGVARFMTSPDIHGDNIPLCHVLEEPGCIAQSYLTTFSCLSSFFWTTFIAFNLYWTYGEPERLSRCAAKVRTAFFHFASWGIPLIIITTALQLNVLGSDLSVGSGAWCWISACLPAAERTLWMTLSGKGWEIIMYTACLAFYILIKKRKKTLLRRARYSQGLTASLIRSLTSQQPSEESPHEDLRFLFLWLIEIALRIWGTIRYSIALVKRHTDADLTDYDQIDGVFLTLQSIGDSSQALCSCLLFCIFDKETRRLMCNSTCCVRQHSETAPILQTEGATTRNYSGASKCVNSF